MPFFIGGIVNFKEMQKLVNKIKKIVKKTVKDIEPYQDLFYVLLENRVIYPDYFSFEIKNLSDYIEKAIIKFDDENLVKELYLLHRKVLLAGAPYNFHCYCLMLEWKRSNSSKFYEPRRMQLEPLTKDFQALEERKIDLLALSLPPGTGKTTIAIFYLTWKAGRNPNSPMLSASHSTEFVSEVYKECLNIMTNDEYTWKEIFPQTPIVDTNAKGLRLDLGQKKRFQTLQFTSIGTGNAGKYRAEQLLYCDDLVSGIEVALSKDRLDKLWNVYSTDLRQRKIGDKCGELHIATRWSVHDVIGRLEREYGDNPRYVFKSIPAMNDEDESNFDYKEGKGFTTQFYKEQRLIMDDLDWRALYMNLPIEREGQLYPEEELRRYFDLPDEEPDAIIAVCDTKDRGKDYAVLPVAYKYGDNYYIEDVVVDNSNPEVIDVRLVDILLKHRVHLCRFESNSAGGRVAKDVQEAVDLRGGNTHITTKFTTANKETKIIVNASWIKKHCLFRDKSRYMAGSEYHRFIEFLTGYTVLGRNKNDDVPDAMAMLSEYAQSLSIPKVEIFQRLW